MGHRASRKVLTAVALAALASSACRRSPYRTLASNDGAVSCEAPRDWDVDRDNSLLVVTAREEIREVTPYIAIYGDKPRTRASLEAEIAADKRTMKADPRFSIESLVELEVAGTRAYQLSSTNSALQPHQHRETPQPDPVQVREMEIFLTINDRSIRILYYCPIELDSKHRPVFEHLLRTLQVRPH